jgi:hypothetical protein
MTGLFPDSRKQSSAKEINPKAVETTHVWEHKDIRVIMKMTMPAEKEYKTFAMHYYFLFKFNLENTSSKR